MVKSSVKLMFRKSFFVGMAGLLMLDATAPAFAHHAFAAEFDADKPVQITGKLTRVEWTNPHGWIYLDVVAKDGRVTNWSVEFGGPNALLRRGIRMSDFKIGEEVKVKGFLAKSGRPVVNGVSVKLPDGRDFFTGSSGTGAPIEGAGR
ncbi:MAG TPA: DUF6152 family protein [Steroidobacteraceae bacterium]|nr:DUF6152 family protein [Steroidobacteraceae bacterium]